MKGIWPDELVEWCPQIIGEFYGIPYLVIEVHLAAPVPTARQKLRMVIHCTKSCPRISFGPPLSHWITFSITDVARVSSSKLVRKT